MSNAKHEAVELIKQLPDDVTLEDIQHHLAVLEKIKQGQIRLAQEGGIPQTQMEDAMADAIAAMRAHALETGQAKPKSQTEVFAKARAVLG